MSDDSENVKLLRRLCSVLTDCVGERDGELDDDGLFAFGLRAAKAYSERSARGWIREATELVCEARALVTEVMCVLDPADHAEVIARITAKMGEAGAGGPSARDAALEACRLIDDNDLVIQRIRRLIALTRGEATEEGRTAASIAVKLFHKEELRLLPARSEEPRDE